MATSNENPFVFPGMGQANPDFSGNPLMASMEMMRKAWAGLAGPGGLTQSLPMAPPMNLEELDKRIAELKSIEGWLSMNLSMLSSTIQGMEVQRSTISTLRSFVDAMSQAPGDFASGQSPLEAVLGIRRPSQPAKRPDAPGDTASPGSAGASAGERAGNSEKTAGSADSGADAGAQGAQAGTQGERGGPGAQGAHGAVPPGGASAGGFPFGGADAAQSASQAWWDLLQQQFKQLASATAATMPTAATASGATAGRASGAGATGSKASTAQKPASPKQAATAGATRTAPRKAASKSARAPAKSPTTRSTGAPKKPSGKAAK